MTNYHYVLFAIFAVIAYMIVVDSNVAQFIILLWKMANVQIRRGIFILKFKPRLMWDTWNLKRTINGKKGDWADQEAEKILKDLDKQTES